MSKPETTKEELRKEIVHELERSIVVLKNDDGSFGVNIGNGAITFVINPSVKGDPDVK